ncbi:hypothetical protein [Caldisericum sp. AR60]
MIDPDSKFVNMLNINIHYKDFGFVNTHSYLSMDLVLTLFHSIL